MEYLAMLDELKGMGYNVRIESAGSLWKVYINDEIYIDEHLEGLIGVIFNKFVL